MSLRNNGEIFARCAARRCSFRVWIQPYQIDSAEGHEALEQPSSVEESQAARRWGRPASQGQEVRRKKGGGSPAVGRLEISQGPESDEPLTSGDDEEEPEEELPNLAI